MSETTVDVRFNWYLATVVYAAQVPTLSFINSGTPAINSPLRVVLDFGTYDDLLEIRDWLNERGCNYTLFGRYKIIKEDWQRNRKFVGLVFEFETMEESCLFTLFWVGSIAVAA